MKLQRTNLLLQIAIVLGVLFSGTGNVWAFSGTCAIKEGGTGIGGTGTIAKGTGIGGTGITSGGIQLAGRVLFSAGHVEAKNQGSSRALAKGDQICVGDTLKTGQGAVVHVHMEDGGLIQMRQNTQLAIEMFVYKGVQDGNERSSLVLLQGGFRAVTGEIGKLHKENYSIRTANATISIRGTDHEVYYVPESGSGQDPAEQPGTYNHVISGGTVLQNEYGRVLIDPNQTGFMPLRDSAPILLDIEPALFGDRVSEYGRGDERREEEGHSSRESREVLESHEVPEKSETPETTERLERPEQLERSEQPELPEIMEHPEGLEGPET